MVWYACDFIFATCGNEQKMIIHDSVTVMIRTVQEGINGLNATDKTPMYEMPQIYVFGVLGLGLGYMQREPTHWIEIE